MRWLLLALCGCNQIFDLRSTQVVDAPPQMFFDAPVDAPPACPAYGVDPSFSRQLVQVVTQDCTYYSVSLRARWAMAYCYDDAGQTGYFDGPIDQPMVRLRGDLASSAGVLLRSAMLTPEGDSAFADLYDLNTSTGFVGTWKRTSDGSWQRSANTSIPTYKDSIYGSWISPPSATVPRRILVRSPTSASNNMDEYEEGSGGNWTLVKSYSAVDLGISSVGIAQLSPDGLRVLFHGTDSTHATGATFYADRTDASALFGNARYLNTVPAPATGTAQMTEDCSRVYMPALGSIFYAAQR